MAEQLTLPLFELEPPKPIQLWSVEELYERLSDSVIFDAREDRRIERKPCRIQSRALAEYFSMWANTTPEGGIVLVGVDDDGSIHGCSGVEIEHVNELERCGDIFCPDARYVTKHLPVQNSNGKPDFVLAIKADYRPDKLVEMTDGSAFMRRGSSKKKLSDDEKRELKNLKGQVEVENEPTSLEYPDNFSVDLINFYVSAVRQQRGIPHSMSTEEVLELRRLGKIKQGKFTPSLACVVLFANDPQQVIPGCKIRFMRFEGLEERTGANFNSVKNVWIEGNVVQLISQAEDVIDSQIREFARLSPNNKFVSVPEYPKEAWYEALVNACVHRSYNLRNMHIVVKMFDDRLEVESPGGFPPLVTPENIYEMHVPRNHHLMDALFYMAYVQCAHEGTRRIRDAMQSMGLPEPQFRQSEVNAAIVRVTLKNDIEHRKAFVDSDAFRLLGPELSQSLDANERRIVNYVAENGDINVSEAARLIARRWQFTKKILSRLAEREILERNHNAKNPRDAHQFYTLKARYGDLLKRQGKDS